MSRTLKVLSGIGVWALLLMPAWANWQDAVPGARIIGSGDFSVWGFDVYSARLWSAAQPLAPGQPFALELIYRRSLSRDELVKASVDEIKRLAGPGVSPAQLAGWQRQMEQAFIDVQAGTRITGVYLPGQGAHFLWVSSYSTRWTIRSSPGRFSTSGWIRARATPNCASSCWGSQ